MVISDENYYPILIDNIDIPIKTEYFWVLDLEQKDFMLSPLQMFEAIETNTLVVSILGYNFEIPCDWNILVYSDETSQVDIVNIYDLARVSYSAFAVDHQKNKVIHNTVRVLDYINRSTIFTPSLNKNQMLCHSLGTSMWICLSPSDNYLKYIKDASIGDLLP